MLQKMGQKDCTMGICVCLWCECMQVNAFHMCWVINIRKCLALNAVKVDQMRDMCLDHQLCVSVGVGECVCVCVPLVQWKDHETHFIYVS